MPSTVSGIRGTADILANRQRIDISDTIHLLEPSSYPLITFLNSLQKVQPAHNPVVRWMEDELEPLTDLVNGTFSSAADPITVDNGSFWRVGDILHVPRTSENMRVTGIATNDPLSTSSSDSEQDLSSEDRVKQAMLNARGTGLSFAKTVGKKFPRR